MEKGHAIVSAGSVLMIAAAGWLQTPALRFVPLASARFDQLGHLAGVTDVGSDGRHHVVLLDGQNDRIIVTDESLHALSSFGARGTAVGEFIEPIALTRISTGRIAVLDRSLRRITILAINASARSVEAIASVPLSLRATGICALGPTSFLIYAPEKGFRLHVINRSGHVVRSIAPMDKRWSSIASTVLYQGKLECNRTRGVAAVSSDYRPYVDGYQISSGALMWTDTLRPMRAPRIIDRDTSVTVSGGSAGYSLITAVLIGPEYRIYQTTFDGRTDGATIDTTTTYTYQLGARRWLAPGVSLPRLFMLDDGRAIACNPERREVSIGQLTSPTNGPARGHRLGGSENAHN